MGWLIGILVVLAIIYYMIVSPGFRALAIGILILGGLGIYTLIQNENKRSEEYRRQQAAQELWATTSIRPDELAMSGISLDKATYGSDWLLKGTLTNNSKFDLSSVRFLVTIRDCPHAQDCKIIGQESATTMADNFSSRTLLVPVGQVRLFSTYAMKFPNMPPAGNPRWEYKIIEIRAAR